MAVRAYLALGVVLAVLAAYALGHHQGYRGGAQNEVARQAARLEALQEKLDRAEAVTLAQSAKFERDRDELARLTIDLEDQARADPLASGRTPSSDSLRRLRRLWQSEP